jgi:hypothetical protein
MQKSPYYLKILQTFKAIQKVQVKNQQEFQQEQQGYLLLITLALAALVPKVGLEPTQITPHAPETCASTNSATSATDG